MTTSDRSFLAHRVPPALSRRGFLGLAGAAVAAPLLGACSSNSDSETPAQGGGEDNVLTIMTSGLDAAMLDFMQKQIGDSLGLKLKLTTVKDQTYAAQLASAQQAGQAPDVVQWTAEGASALIVTGVALEPLNSYMESVDTSDLYEQDMASGTIGGNLYALAYSVNCRALAYRKDYARDSGPPPEQWTGAEFGEWAAKMNAPKRFSFGWEAKTADGRGSSNFLPLLWSTGGNLVSGEPGSYTLGFDAVQVEKVMQFYYDMVHTYEVTPKDVAGWGYEETDGGFSKGTLASYSVGPFVRGIVGQFPETLKNLAVAPLPNLGTPTTFWESSAFMLHSASKKKDKGWAFIEAVRGEEFQHAMLARTNNGGLSVRKSLNESISDEFLGFFGRILETAGTPSAIDGHPYMDTLFYPGMQEVALRRTPPAEVAGSIMEKATTVLAQTNNS